MKSPMGWWPCALLLCLSVVSSQGASRGGFQVEQMPSLPFQAQFVPGGPSNQFVNAKGTYNGLIVSPGTFVPEQSGYFRLQINDSLGFSGNMVTGDYSTPLFGSFDVSGQVGLYIYKEEWDDCYCYYYLRHVWTVRLQLNPGTDEVEGSVYHVRLGWLSDLFGFRGRRSSDGPAPENGRYTVRFPGSTDATIAPAGDGYGTLTVNSKGQLNLSGKLGDNSSFTESTVVSTNGWWPLYVSFHDGRGSFIGWLQFSLMPTSDLAGDLLWAKPRRDDADYYPNGFVGNIPATGGRYLKPSSSQTPLGWTNGVAWISGGNLSASYTNSITLRNGGKFTDNGGQIDNLTFSLNTGTGVFKGKFNQPESGKKISYTGALHQLTGMGTGFFLDRDLGGFLGLQQAP